MKKFFCRSGIVVLFAIFILAGLLVISCEDISSPLPSTKEKEILPQEDLSSTFDTEVHHSERQKWLDTGINSYSFRLRLVVGGEINRYFKGLSKRYSEVTFIVKNGEVVSSEWIREDGTLHPFPYVVDIIDGEIIWGEYPLPHLSYYKDLADTITNIFDVFIEKTYNDYYGEASPVIGESFLEVGNELYGPASPDTTGKSILNEASIVYDGTYHYPRKSHLYAVFFPRIKEYAYDGTFKWVYSRTRNFSVHQYIEILDFTPLAD
jgi:hypothetical protein